MTWNKIQETSFANNEISKFYFRGKSRFHWRRNPSIKQSFTVEEELDGIDIDGIGSLMDLSGLMFIHEECENLEEVVDNEELTRNNDRKRKSEVL